MMMAITPSLNASNLPVPYMPLRSITLSGNSQLTIVNNAFINFPNVNNLKITKNIFDTNLGAHAFYGLGNLLELDMSGNSQLGMISNHFYTQTHLVTLNLSENNGMILNLESFVGLENLINFYMERSNLVQLQPMIFLPMTNLEVLNLSGNEITQISVSLQIVFE